MDDFLCVVYGIDADSTAHFLGVCENSELSRYIDSERFFDYEIDEYTRDELRKAALI